jgi:hypothetical protein
MLWPESAVDNVSRPQALGRFPREIMNTLRENRGTLCSGDKPGALLVLTRRADSRRRPTEKRQILRAIRHSGPIGARTSSPTNCRAANRQRTSSRAENKKMFRENGVCFCPSGEPVRSVARAEATSSLRRCGRQIGKSGEKNADFQQFAPAHPEASSAAMAKASAQIRLRQPRENAEFLEKNATGPRPVDADLVRSSSDRTGYGSRHRRLLRESRGHPARYAKN